MKHQYFGDENDYRKYGLLRALVAATGLRLGVCWMLTPGDGRSDGRFVEYLATEAWRAHDPELFDALRRRLRRGAAGRHVSGVREDGLLAGAAEYDAEVPETAAARARWFEGALAALAACELVFFDPDNGFEVASVVRGTRGSSRYLYWDEAVKAFCAGHSLLVYQHWPRAPRGTYARRRADELRSRLPGAGVVTFHTARVLFLLAILPQHAARFAGIGPPVFHRWRGQIGVGRSQQPGTSESATA